MNITIRSFTRLLAFVACVCSSSCAIAWDDYGVTTNVNGAWNQAANWTAGGPPGSSDNAFIGGNFPAGSAAIASISLAGNTNINSVYLGRIAGTSGVLDLNGFQLVVANTLSIGQFGGVGQIVHNGGSFQTSHLEVQGNNSVTLAAGDTTSTLLIASSVTLTTAATSNITTSVFVNSPNASLNLGADLSVTGDIDLRGSGTQAAILDANGFDVTARDIYLGRFGLLGTILNDGAIHATRNLTVSGGTFTLDANDIVNETVIASEQGVLTLDANTAALNAFVASGGTINTVATGNLSQNAQIFDATSLLNMGADLNLNVDLEIRGSASQSAIVNANGFDITARDIYVGRFGLLGEILNDGAITATRNFEVSGGTFSLDANDSVAVTVAATNGGTLNLHANTAAQNAFVDSAGTINTVATSNLTQTAQLFNDNSLLNLGDDLQLNFDLEIRGSASQPATVNANNFDITARDIYVGRFGLLGEILNDGSITATRNFEVSGGTFSLDANDSVAVTVAATNGGTLNLHANTASQNAFVNSAGTINTVATSNLTQTAQIFSDNSLLNLGDDLQLTFDLEIRGSASQPATVNANNFDITARDIYVGRFGLLGEILNDGAITATRNFEVSGGTFSLDANDSVAVTVAATNGGTLNLHANTAAQNAFVSGGGLINLVSSSNLANNILVIDAQSSLVMGDSINVNSIELRGSTSQTAILDASGNDIDTGFLFVGRFGLQGELLNDGAVTAADLNINNSELVFNDGNDWVTSSLSLSADSLFEVFQATGQTSGLTFSGNLLQILDSSVLQLTFDSASSQGLDWAFRWANPLSGDRVSTLNSLLSGGQLAIQSTQTVGIFDGGDGYTYVGYNAVPEPSSLILGCAFAAWALSQRRRRSE